MERTGVVEGWSCESKTTQLCKTPVNRTRSQEDEYEERWSGIARVELGGELNFFVRVVLRARCLASLVSKCPICAARGTSVGPPTPTTIILPWDGRGRGVWTSPASQCAILHQIANVSTITSLVSSHLWPSRVSETSIASAISTTCACHHPQGRRSPLEPLQIAFERSRPLSAVYHGILPILLFILHTDVQLVSISGRRASTLRATLCCMYAAAPRPSHQNHQFRVRQRGSPAPTLARLAADSAEKFRLRNGIMLVSWTMIRQCLKGGSSNTKPLT